MDEIEQRLKDTTATCITCYEAWQGNQKNEEARESLAEAIHELRKVASRLEIEIAVSEREQMTGRPLAIPPHRSSRKAQAGDDAGYGDMDDDVGNMMPDDNAGNGVNAGQPRRQNNNMRRPGGGSGGGQNRGRRPGGPRPNQGNGGNE